MVIVWEAYRTYRLDERERTVTRLSLISIKDMMEKTPRALMMNVFETFS